MATKNNPGAFDCYKKADGDEPMFVLLGRDPVAATIVRGWVVTREHLADEGIIVRDENHIRQINEALDLAAQLEKYAGALGKENALQVLRDLDPLGSTTTEDAPNTGHPHD